jgi:hypothetical protein
MSRTAYILIVVLAAAGACALPPTARAQQLRSTDQLPGLTDQQSDKVTISNIGNAALNISYLDGDWKTIQIPSGQFVTLPSQSAGVSVAFSDGVEAKSATLNRGTAYALYWNAGLSRWAIAPYDEVAKRPSGLRPR